MSKKKQKKSKKNKEVSGMPRGTPKPRKGKNLLAWRSRQKPGAIMSPSTFEEIETKAKKRYGISKKRAEKVAGKAYQTTLKAKYRKAKKR